MKSFFLAGFSAMAILVGVLLALPATGSLSEKRHTPPESPVPGKVTLVDLGARTCIPCKMMVPILEELEKEYTDRAAILFIDILENPEAGRKYGIQLIPTLIFYDAGGKEVFRHEGFMDKAAIVARLAKLGVR